MATVKRIKPKKPVDRVAYEPVMCAVSKARAMAAVLEQLGEEHNNLVFALYPKETREWLHGAVADTLRATLDEIEREYRDLRTDLLQKEVEKLTPKDGT